MPYLISVCGYWHKGGSKADRNVVRVHHVFVAEIGKVLLSCSLSNNNLLVQGSINRSPWPWEVVEKGKKVAHDNEDTPEIGVYITNNIHKQDIFSSSLSSTILRLSPTWARIWRGRALWSQTRALTPALSEDLVKTLCLGKSWKKASLSQTHVRFQRVGEAKLTPDTLFALFQGDLTS